MAEDGEENREPPEDEGHRGIENAVMLGFFVVVVAAGIWLLATRCTKGAGLRRPGTP
jgi:hypothetical protein